MPKLSIILIFTFASISTLNAAMYKWVADDGTVTYSQIPPNSQKSREKVKPPPPPAETPEQIMSNLNNQLQIIEDKKEDEELRAAKQAPKNKSVEQSKKNCKISQNNLEIYKNRPANARYKDKKGNVNRLTNDQRQEKIKMAMDNIKKYCP